MVKVFKNINLILSFSLFLGLLSGCASVQTREEKLNSLKENQINLDGLNAYDLAYLDQRQYFVNLKSYTTPAEFKKKVGVIIITEDLKQKKVNLNTIYLRHWVKKELNRRNYYIDRISDQVPVVILVEYGLVPVSNKEYENKFENLLFKKILKIRAIDYLTFKKKGKVQVYWSSEISIVGPSTDMTKLLPVLASFLNESLETNLDNKKIITPSNDPRLEATKDVPNAISVDDFKPTVEELEFFN